MFLNSFLVVIQVDDVELIWVKFGRVRGGGY